MHNLKFPMRRRVASEGSIEESEDSFSDHNIRFKSQNLPSEDLFKTSQALLDERNYAKQFQQFYSHLKFAHVQLQVQVYIVEVFCLHLSPQLSI